MNGGKTGIDGTPTWEEDFTLDALGNWSGYLTKASGGTTLNQSRSHNLVNEIDTDNTHGDSDNSITETVGTAWADPVHDAAGNMTTMPSPLGLATGLTLSYDAWNRLVRVANGQTTVAEYEYDGRNFRTLKKVYAGGQLSETRHFYYNDAWQCLEERVDASTTAACQYVWGNRYVDDLVLRDRDTDANGTLDERYYALQDPNWNVIAIADTGGDVSRRYAYSAYGQPVFLRPIFVSYGGNVGEWEALYTGQRYDRETGLYNYRNRYYHPDLGRFVSRDPIESSANLYAYCDNYPTNATDPFGWITWRDFRKVRSGRYDAEIFRTKYRLNLGEATTDCWKLDADMATITCKTGCPWMCTAQYASATVSVNMDKKRSYVIKGRESGWLLAHEQLHLAIWQDSALLATWDIQGYEARREGCSKNAALAAAKADARQHAISTRGRAEQIGDSVNNRYDSESNHGLIKDKQAWWQENWQEEMMDAWGYFQ